SAGFSHSLAESLNNFSNPFAASTYNTCRRSRSTALPAPTAQGVDGRKPILQQEANLSTLEEGWTTLTIVKLPLVYFPAARGCQISDNVAESLAAQPNDSNATLFP
ncbi:TPA: hypothetical protein ACKE3D_006054, partial [Burkholderia dolosa]